MESNLSLIREMATELKEIKEGIRGDLSEMKEMVRVLLERSTEGVASAVPSSAQPPSNAASASSKSTATPTPSSTPETTPAAASDAVVNVFAAPTDHLAEMHAGCSTIDLGSASTTTASATPSTTYAAAQDGDLDFLVAPAKHSTTVHTKCSTPGGGPDVSVPACVDISSTIRTSSTAKSTLEVDKRSDLHTAGKSYAMELSHTAEYSSQLGDNNMEKEDKRLQYLDITISYVPSAAVGMALRHLQTGIHNVFEIMPSSNSKFAKEEVKSRNSHHQCLVCVSIVFGNLSYVGNVKLAWCSKPPKPPWLLLPSIEVTGSWSEQMELMDGYLLEASPWSAFNLGSVISGAFSEDDLASRAQTMMKR